MPKNHATVWFYLDQDELEEKDSIELACSCRLEFDGGLKFFQCRIHKSVTPAAIEAATKQRRK